MAQRSTIIDSDYSMIKIRPFLIIQTRQMISILRFSTIKSRQITRNQAINRWPGRQYLRRQLVARISLPKLAEDLLHLVWATVTQDVT